jgi:hypothetical protein
VGRWVGWGVMVVALVRARSAWMTGVGRWVGWGVMMVALVRALSASITAVGTWVQIASFLSPRLWHELVGSTAQRESYCGWVPLVEVC